jgi:polyisoprenoid-binding protein YceI
MKKTLLTAILLMGATAFANTYKIDTANSNILWKAGKKVGSFHNGDVKIKEGTVEADKKGKIKSINVVADMKTIANEDLKNEAEYQKKLIGHLASDDFFKVDKFPDATFALTSITPKAGSKDEYMVKGNLTMIGNTQPVEFPAKITTEKKMLKGTATIQIERLKWGLQYGSGSVFKTLTADKIINDTFELTLNLTAKK